LSLVTKKAKLLTGELLAMVLVNFSMKPTICHDVTWI